MNKNYFSQTLLGAGLFAFSFIAAKPILPNPQPVISKPQVLGLQTQVNLSPIKTLSRFTTKIRTYTVSIPKNVIKKDDPNSEIGTETIINSGRNGEKKITTTTTLYDGQEYSTDTSSQIISSPEDEIIAEGTKIVWRAINTPQGQIRYWRKIHVWATQYDSHCLGCDEWTATGLRQGKGVIAVDPSVIKLGTHVYIPGYGLAIAGDTGGAVIGNRIDVGFEDTRTSGWYSHYVDIYLL